MNSHSIRRATATDAVAIARHRYFKAGECADDLDAYVRWVAPRIAQQTYLGFLAIADDSIVGGAGGVLLDWGPSRGNALAMRARIVNVFSEPAWRTRGVARSLVEHVLAACEERGVRDFSLATTEEGAAMYRSLGFTAYRAEMIRRPGVS